MTKPKRIQRKRTKGWRMPANTVSVTRPGPFGNPFVVGKDCDQPGEAVELFRRTMQLAADGHDFGENEHGLNCLEIYRHLDWLCGKNLACYCPFDKPCHADVLLELANR
jgi:hypothetical protein